MPASSHVPLAEWRRAIREGECDIQIRGFSHVFVPTPTDGSVSDEAAVPNAPGCTQETYGRQDLRDILLAYLEGAVPNVARQDNVGATAKAAPAGSTADQPAEAVEAPADTPSHEALAIPPEPEWRPATGVAATIERLIADAPVAEEEEEAWLGTVAVATVVPSRNANWSRDEIILLLDLYSSRRSSRSILGFAVLAEVRPPRKLPATTAIKFERSRGQPFRSRYAGTLREEQLSGLPVKAEPTELVRLAASRSC